MVTFYRAPVRPATILHIYKGGAKKRWFRAMGELRFCPFCREAFDDVTHCPEHELELVPWLALRGARGSSQTDGPVAWFSPRHGRGLVAAGALLTLLSFAVLSLARVHGDVTMGADMLRFAMTGRAPRLWLVPAAAIAQLAVLYRRRTPQAMRGARLVTLMLSLVPSAAVVWALAGVDEAVGLLAERSGKSLHVDLGAGAIAIWLSALPMIVGSLRLGK